MAFITAELLVKRDRGPFIHNFLKSLLKINDLWINKVPFAYATLTSVLQREEIDEEFETVRDFTYLESTGHNSRCEHCGKVCFMEDKVQS